MKEPARLSRKKGIFHHGGTEFAAIVGPRSRVRGLEFELETRDSGLRTNSPSPRRPQRLRGEFLDQDGERLSRNKIERDISLRRSEKHEVKS
jgi:hypothetical protein